MSFTEKLSPSDSILSICLLASFSDGEKCDHEREHVRGLADDLGNANLANLSRNILLGKLSLEAVVSSLETQQDRMAAYEMARAVCEADDLVSPGEADFLKELKTRLGLSKDTVKELDGQVDALALVPVTSAAPEAPVAENKGMILKYAILNGALELLPETLATVAIIPLQMKMVYRIGKSHGAELDRRSIVEFLATAGVGMGSQMVEGFARKLVKKLGQRTLGKMAGNVASAATGSAFSFASTYAMGHLAEKYYSGGRTLAAKDRKPLLASLSEEGKQLHARYLPEIEARSKTLNPSAILSLVQGKQQP